MYNKFLVKFLSGITSLMLLSSGCPVCFAEDQPEKIFVSSFEEFEKVLNSAVTGQEVILKNGFNISNDVNIGKSITVDLNGNKVVCDYDKSISIGRKWIQKEEYQKKHDGYFEDVKKKVKVEGEGYYENDTYIKRPDFYRTVIDKVWREPKTVTYQQKHDGYYEYKTKKEIVSGKYYEVDGELKKRPDWDRIMINKVYHAPRYENYQKLHEGYYETVMKKERVSGKYYLDKNKLKERPSWDRTVIKKVYHDPKEVTYQKLHEGYYEPVTEKVKVSGKYYEENGVLKERPSWDRVVTKNVYREPKETTYQQRHEGYYETVLKKEKVSGAYYEKDGKLIRRPDWERTIKVPVNSDDEGVTAKTEVRGRTNKTDATAKTEVRGRTNKADATAKTEVRGGANERSTSAKMQVRGGANERSTSAKTEIRGGKNYDTPVYYAKPMKSSQNKKQEYKIVKERISGEYYEKDGKLVKRPEWERTVKTQKWHEPYYTTEKKIQPGYTERVKTTEKISGEYYEKDGELVKRPEWVRTVKTQKWHKPYYTTEKKYQPGYTEDVKTTEKVSGEYYEKDGKLKKYPEWDYVYSEKKWHEPYYTTESRYVEGYYEDVKTTQRVSGEYYEKDGVLLKYSDWERTYKEKIWHEPYYTTESKYIEGHYEDVKRQEKVEGEGYYEDGNYIKRPDFYRTVVEKVWHEPYYTTEVRTIYPGNINVTLKNGTIKSTDGKDGIPEKGRKNGQDGSKAPLTLLSGKLNMDNINLYASNAGNGVEGAPKIGRSGGKGGNGGDLISFSGSKKVIHNKCNFYIGQGGKGGKKYKSFMSMIFNSNGKNGKDGKAIEKTERM